MGLGMRWLLAAEVHERSVRSLHLDQDLLDLTAPEAKAALVRRCASYLCPCPPRIILERALEVLRGLIPIDTALKDELSEILEALIAYGDVFELHESSASQLRRGTLLFLRPPSFVMRKSGMTFLIGIARSDALPLVPTMQQEIESINYVRRISPRTDVNLRSILKQMGLLEIPEEHWLKLPRIQTPMEHLNRLNGSLDMAPPAGHIPDLTLIEPSLPVHYYKGRWQTISKQTGRFVARRPQAYGADLWCYVEVREGHVMKLVDLPIRVDYRGCDEAWRLQAAIDADRRNPQICNIRDLRDSGYKLLEFFSPLPMWARRRFDVVGEPRSISGCLFAYKIPTSEFDQEVAFLRDVLWISVTT
jgi:hypothetical protein